MKLRLHDDSIRLRLRRPEVETLCREGAVESRTRLAANVTLVYRLETAPVDHIELETRGHDITIRLPRRDAEGWEDNQRVGFEASVSIADDVLVQVLVEKDFKCIDGDSDEDQSDAYPNPQEGAAC